MMAAAKRRFGRVRQLPSGRWQARYRGPDGADHPAPHTFRTKRDAEVWLSQAEAQLIRGTWIAPDAGKVTVGEWGRRWLEAASPQLKVKTRATYGSLLRTMIEPAFGTVPVSAVRPIMVHEWVASMTRRLSPSRVRQSYRLLSQIMRSAVDNDLIALSPCRGVRLPRLPETEPHILTPAEVDRIAAKARPPHDLLVQLLGYAGLRIGEAFALRRSDIDLRAGSLTVSEGLVEVSGRLSFDSPKSHQRRTLALPAFLVERLREHLDQVVAPEQDGLLFLGRTGRPLHYNSWRTTRFDPAVAAAGLDDVTPHDLRASHATWVADSHGVMAAARRLGHANASVTTRHYARTVDGRDQQVAQHLDAGRRDLGRSTVDAQANASEDPVDDEQVGQ